MRHSGDILPDNSGQAKDLKMKWHQSLNVRLEGTNFIIRGNRLHADLKSFENTIRLLSSDKKKVEQDVHAIYKNLVALASGYSTDRRDRQLATLMSSIINNTSARKAFTKLIDAHFTEDARIRRYANDAAWFNYARVSSADSFLGLGYLRADETDFELDYICEVDCGNISDYQSLLDELQGCLLENDGDDDDLEYLCSILDDFDINCSSLTKELLKQMARDGADIQHKFKQSLGLQARICDRLSVQFSEMQLQHEKKNGLDKLQACLPFLRSYRVRCILIVQHLGQLVATYGKEHVRSFHNSKVKMCFTLNDIDDARYFSSILGKKSVKIRSKSVSLSGSENTYNHGRTHHVQYHTKALLTPDELMQMKRNKCVIVMEGENSVFANKVK